MRLALIAAAATAVLLAGCGKTENKADEASTPATAASGAAGTPAPSVAEAGTDATAEAPKVVIPGKTGDATLKTPDFAPLYEGGKLTSSVSGLSKGDTNSGTYVYSVDATPEAVTAFYKEKGEAAGLKTSLDADMGQARMYAGTDEAANRGMQVIASTAQGKTTVQVMWAVPK